MFSFSIVSLSTFNDWKSIIDFKNSNKYNQFKLIIETNNNYVIGSRNEKGWGNTRKKH